MKTPRSGYVYKYRKAREAALKHRERFGKPDDMEPDKREQYGELLQEAALNIVQLKMHLGEVGLNVIEQEESLADVKNLVSGRTRLDELLDEYHDSIATLTVQDEDFKSYFKSIDSNKLKQSFLNIIRKDFYSRVLESEVLDSRDDFDMDTIWEIFDEANISTTESFIERKIKLVPILASKSPSPTLKSYVQLVSSLFLLASVIS